MSEPFIGEIRMFGGNFSPRGWAFCDGQLLAVSQNDALFSLLGTFYGGDGRTTFGLPDMRGRLPIHKGQGPGLSDYTLGRRGGVEHVTLLAHELANHSHEFMANTASATDPSPEGRMIAQGVGTTFYSEATPNASLASNAMRNSGGAQSHDNTMPSLCVSFIIALFGIYPSRN